MFGDIIAGTGDYLINHATLEELAGSGNELSLCLTFQ